MSFGLHEYTLTEDEASRFKKPVQTVIICLDREYEKRPDKMHVAMAKDVYSLDGRRMGGRLGLSSHPKPLDSISLKADLEAGQLKLMLKKEQADCNIIIDELIQALNKLSDYAMKKGGIPSYINDDIEFAIRLATK